jgi:uncharacterized surface protein with fasciclin (FAS1) repeats
MASFGSSTIGDMKSMYDFTDLRGGPRVKTLNPTTLAGMIKANPDTTMFSHILTESGLEGQYDQDQANFTLFVPLDSGLTEYEKGILRDADPGFALAVVKTSTMNSIITSELLEYSPSSLFVTLDISQKLKISNYAGKTYIGNSAELVDKDIYARNGLIHHTNGINLP